MGLPSLTRTATPDADGIRMHAAQPSPARRSAAWQIALFAVLGSLLLMTGWYMRTVLQRMEAFRAINDAAVPASTFATGGSQLPWQAAIVAQRTIHAIWNSGLVPLDVPEPDVQTWFSSELLHSAGGPIIFVKVTGTPADWNAFAAALRKAPRLEALSLKFEESDQAEAGKILSGLPEFKKLASVNLTFQDHTPDPKWFAPVASMPSMRHVRLRGFEPTEEMLAGFAQNPQIESISLETGYQRRQELETKLHRISPRLNLIIPTCSMDD